MIRSLERGRFATACVLGSAALMVAGAAVAVGGPLIASTAPAAGVEDEGADCPVSLPGSLTANPKLPDPFKRIDGSRIATTSDWRCRREEISKLAQRHVYGTKPAKPANVSARVPILRGIPGESGAQPLSSAHSEQPWLGDAFSSFTGDPTRLPVDTHEMVGMVAPRGLFVMENPHIDWLAARSGSVAALGGAEVYKALGAGSAISYWSDVQDGTHCAVRPEWKAPLQQSLRAFLLKKGNPPGVFRVSSLKAGNLASWRDWTTPTLTGSTHQRRNS